MVGQQLDEIVDILLETVCTNRKSIRVAGDDYPAELVKAKFFTLSSRWSRSPMRRVFFMYLSP